MHPAQNPVPVHPVPRGPLAAEAAARPAGTEDPLGDGRDRGQKPVLEQLVRSGCVLINARSGILHLAGTDLPRHFITAGIDEPRHGEPSALTLPVPDSRDLPMKSLLEVPIRASSGAAGSICWIDKIDGDEFTADDEEAAIALATAAGRAISHSLRPEEDKRRALWLDACIEVSGRIALGDGRSGTGGLRFIADQARRGPGASQAVVLVPASDHSTFVVVAAAGGDEALAAGGTVHLGAALSDLLHASAGLALLDDGAELAAQLSGPSTGNVLAISLQTRDLQPGWLILSGAQAPGFTRTDVEMGAYFGSHAASALELESTRVRREEELMHTDRERIARDLHDNVIQRLFAAGLGIQALPNISDREETVRRVGAITTELDESIRELRETIYALNPSGGGDATLSSRILRTLNSGTGTVVPRLTLKGPIDQLTEPNLTTQLLATLSEALSNTALHPGADTISVEITAGPAELVLRVQDNGTGFGRHKHGGLINLEHRARGLGGSSTVRSSASGTLLEWAVPMP
ncbi:hypothetical protein BMF89_02090 [Arthrobacter sp. SRS-W-1-2016]|uniref:sensor histidine kinase n=1 Tax=Arthrobacter sp. SRS-W-1-2016 TaxID=1930254 RepID=UPI0009912F21|nr:histidine kinase [Arthrobacter sp. SRS-W-1-2016]OOP64778.1 hypothetical protein BMF89_02090 [Arthrobacter sp. SRS-W-1-2016]